MVSLVIKSWVDEARGSGSPGPPWCWPGGVRLGTGTDFPLCYFSCARKKYLTETTCGRRGCFARIVKGSHSCFTWLSIITETGACGGRLWFLEKGKLFSAGLALSSLLILSGEAPWSSGCLPQ